VAIYDHWLYVTTICFPFGPYHEVVER